MSKQSSKDLNKLVVMLFYIYTFLVSLPSSRLNVHVNQTVRRSKASGLNSKTSISSRVCLLTRCEMKVSGEGGVFFMGLNFRDAQAFQFFSYM